MCKSDIMLSIGARNWPSFSKDGSKRGMDTNPLLNPMVVARELVRRLEEQTGVTLPDGAMMWLLHGDSEAFPADVGGAPLYPMQELGCMAGPYRWLASQDLGEAVFATKRCWEVRGLSAAPHDLERQRRWYEALRVGTVA